MGKLRLKFQKSSICKVLQDSTVIHNIQLALASMSITYQLGQSVWLNNGILEMTGRDYTRSLFLLIGQNKFDLNG